MKLRLTVAAGSAAALVASPVALAHVTANPAEAPTDSFAMIAFRVPHGCDESPTTSLTIQIPPGVTSVAPQAVPGWEVSVVEGPLAEPVESHGETITEGVTEVTWTGGPLDPHQFTDFGLSMKLPNAEGETLHFPAVQTCEEGETRWIQLPVEGEPEPEEPAPALLLTAATGGHGSAAGATADGTAVADGAAAAAAADDGDGMSDELALGLGAGGLAAGLVALGAVAMRRPRRR
jgi:uncharacterized protein YcnI